MKPKSPALSFSGARPYGFSLLVTLQHRDDHNDFSPLEVKLSGDGIVCPTLFVPVSYAPGFLTGEPGHKSAHMGKDEWEILYRITSKQ